MIEVTVEAKAPESIKPGVKKNKISGKIAPFHLIYEKIKLLKFLFSTINYRVRLGHDRSIFNIFSNF